MKIIKLTKGTEAIVDDFFYDQLVEMGAWFNMKGYACRNNYQDGENLGAIYMHHIVLPPPDGFIIDHIDRNKLNNQKHNLRVANKHINALNSKIRSDNTSGLRGISFDAARGKWKVQLKLYDNRIIKRFYTLQEAVEFHKSIFPTL